jgi:O-succinylbenzoic acid--CoA ligase
MTSNSLNLNHLVEKYGDNPALIWPEGKLSYHQYFQHISHMSTILKKKGIHPGKKVAILSEVHHLFPVLFFALLNSGGIVIPINPKLPTKKKINLIRKVDCDLVITLDQAFSPDPDNNINVISGNSLFDRSIEIDKAQSFPSLPLEQEATVVFTSGTQGNPRGALHTIGNHYYSALGSNQNIPLNQSDRWMVTLPFYHIAGIAILFRTLMAGGACLIPESARSIQHQISKYNVTHLSLVSTQLHRWMAEDKTIKSSTSLKAILLGGSQILPILIEQALKQKLPIYSSYGSTEMCSQITTTKIEDLKLNPKSSGKLLSNRELKIDKNGEVLVRGKTLGIGYFFRKNIVPFADDKGWFHTGDLGYIDENQDLIITGRQDNMFVSGGENIHPEEIERQLQFYNHIIDVCVVDVRDEEFGARPVAFIKMESDEQINETTLKNDLKEKLATYEIPVRFFAWPEDIENLKPDRNYFRELAKSIMVTE